MSAICIHFMKGTCRYGDKCNKKHITQSEVRIMNRNLSPCFDFCAFGKCKGHDGQGCNFARTQQDYIDACNQHGKKCDAAIIELLRGGEEKALMSMSWNKEK